MKVGFNGILFIEILFHPVSAFNKIKEHRDELKYYPVLALLALITAVRAVSVYGVHFPVSTADIRESNVLIQTGLVLIPLLTWVVSAYAMTSIMDGEVKFKELAVATTFSTAPYILFGLPLMGLSYLFDLNGKATFDFFNGLVIVWVAALVLMNLKMLNGYTLAKTIRVALLSIAAIIVIWFLLFVFYALTIQVLDFIKLILMEIRLKIR